MYGHKSRTTAKACPICKKELKASDYIEGDPFEREMDRDLQKRKEVMGRCKIPRKCFQTIEDYYDFLEKLEDLILNFRESIDMDQTRNSLDSLAKKCEEMMRAEEKKKTLKIEEGDEEFDWGKLKIPTLIEKDKPKTDVLRSMLDLRYFGQSSQLPKIKDKIQKAAGFSNEDCHARGIQELTSSIHNFL
jgi:hypothetical protein